MFSYAIIERCEAKLLNARIPSGNKTKIPTTTASDRSIMITAFTTSRNNDVANKRTSSWVEPCTDKRNVMIVSNTKAHQASAK